MLAQYFDKKSVTDLNFATGAKITGKVSVIDHFLDTFTPHTDYGDWFDRDECGTITDISKWNGMIDWQKMWSKVDGVVARSGYGGITDERFDIVVVPGFSMPEAQGKYRALYHYMNTGVSVSNHLNVIRRCIDKLGGVHAFWCDAEAAYNDTSSPDFRGNTLGIMQVIKEEYPEINVGVYTNAGGWEMLGSPVHWLKEYLFWYARYPHSYVRYPKPPAGLKVSDIYMWQYSAGGNGRGPEFGGASPDMDISVTRDPRAEFLLENLDQGEIVVPDNKLDQLKAEQAAMMASVKSHSDKMIEIAMDAPEVMYEAVTTDVLKVRIGPGIEYAQIATLPSGTPVEVFAEKPGGDYVWAKISPSDEQWVANQWLAR